jgi:hypothetical protein
LLSPDGAARVRAAFDAALDQAVVLKFKVPVPHIAGEWAEDKSLDSMVVFPTIGGKLEFSGGAPALDVEADPARAVMRELAAANEDPAALEAVYAAHPAELEAIDGTDSSHILRHFLDIIPRIPPASDRGERVGRALGRNVLTVIENGAEDYPRAWTGTGERWHVHPPHFARAGWIVAPVPGDEEGSPEPSQFDRGSSAEYGQNLTLIFQPDGFDAWDLAASRKIEYRSENWRRHFDAAHAALARKLGP